MTDTAKLKTPQDFVDALLQVGKGPFDRGHGRGVWDVARTDQGAEGVVAREASRGRGLARSQHRTDADRSMTDKYIPKKPFRRDPPYSG